MILTEPSTRFQRYCLLIFCFIMVLFFQELFLVRSFAEQSAPDSLGVVFKGQELETWNALYAGREMDFRKTKLDEPSTWPESRVLSLEFIKTLLLPEYKKALAGKPIIIKGAWFKDDLDLSNTEFSNEMILGYCHFDGQVKLDFSLFRHSLIIGGSVFEKGLSFHGGTVRGQLKLTGNTIKDNTNFQGLNVTGSMIIKNSTLNQLTLSNAKIGGQLRLKAQTSFEHLNLQGIHISQSLFIDTVEQSCDPCGKKGLRLSRAKIGGTLLIRNSNFSGMAHLESMDIGTSVLVTEKSHFHEGVLFDGSTIKGRLSLSSSIIAGLVSMRGISVGSTLAMRNQADFKGDLILTSANIGNLVTLSDGSLFHGKVAMEGMTAQNACLCDGAEFFKEVDLSGAAIKGSLELSTGWDFLQYERRKKLEEENNKNGIPSIWKDSLDLRAAEADSFQVPESWKTPLRLNGFIYKRFGSSETGNETAMLQRPGSWFVDFLKNADLSAQPYEQAGKVLKESGEFAKADAVLYAGRLRAHKKKGWFKSVKDLLLWALIGYGYFTFRALISIAVFMISGMVLIKYDAVGAGRPLWWRAFFSFDRLLPIITLDKRFSDQDIETVGIRMYFYFHQIMGYVLATFIAAGVSGLTR